MIVRNCGNAILTQCTAHNMMGRFVVYDDDTWDMNTTVLKEIEAGNPKLTCFSATDTFSGLQIQNKYVAYPYIKHLQHLLTDNKIVKKFSIPFLFLNPLCDEALVAFAKSIASSSVEELSLNHRLFEIHNALDVALAATYQIIQEVEVFREPLFERTVRSAINAVDDFVSSNASKLWNSALNVGMFIGKWHDEPLTFHERLLLLIQHLKGGNVRTLNLDCIQFGSGHETEEFLMGLSKVLEDVEITTLSLKGCKLAHCNIGPLCQFAQSLKRTKVTKLCIGDNKLHFLSLDHFLMLIGALGQSGISKLDMWGDKLTSYGEEGLMQISQAMTGGSIVEFKTDDREGKDIPDEYFHRVFCPVLSHNDELIRRKKREALVMAVGLNNMSISKDPLYEKNLMADVFKMAGVGDYSYRAPSAVQTDGEYAW